MSTYIISDTHFNHERVVEWRGFSSLEEMEDRIISNWNSNVTDNDKVIHLGDFILGDPDRVNNILSRLHYKNLTLVLGNHDTRAKVNQYVMLGITVVGSLEKILCGKKVLMTHYPVHFQQKERYDLNIHGHVHDLKTAISEDHFYVNVTCESTNYTPILLKDILEVS